jgi:hypothetical protein
MITRRWPEFRLPDKVGAGGMTGVGGEESREGEEDEGAGTGGVRKTIRTYNPFFPPIFAATHTTSLLRSASLDISRYRYCFSFPVWRLDRSARRLPRLFRNCPEKTSTD